MQLMRCLACDDLVALSGKQALCRCGRSLGRVVDGESMVLGPCRILQLVLDPGADGVSGWWSAVEDTRHRLRVLPLL